MIPDVGMIYSDEEGRLGMEFYPAWWDNQRTEVLRVKFILPEECEISEMGGIAQSRSIQNRSVGEIYILSC